MLNTHSDIDIVYLWVDGSDPAFIKSKALYENSSVLGGEANHICRFTDCEELKYSLRSLHRYARWVRKVHIVTNGQIPKWLDVNHPKINLVTHEQIFPNKAHLPTFSATAIECHIHRITGLSEKFLLANDDTFFGNYVYPSTFFDNEGLVFVMLSPDVFAPVNTAKLLTHVFGLKKWNCATHQLRAYTKTVFQNIEAEFPIMLDVMSSRRFRHPNDIVMNFCFIPNYVLENEWGRPGKITSAWIDLMDDFEAEKLKELDREAQLFCINNSLPSHKEKLGLFLESCFPESSPFEIGR